MLACARLGAIHSVVFGGFAANELATRIEDAKPKVIVSASCGIEPGRLVEYKPLLDAAIDAVESKPERCIVLQRPMLEAGLDPRRDVEWNEALGGAEPAACVSLEATDPLYIIYTSGTTGQPKGIVRDNGGHAVALEWSMKAIYDVDPGEVYWAASDIGWTVGHSYTVYAPLFHGCTTVLYEGKPVGTPDAGAFWRVIEQHDVCTLFTAPTAFRAIRQQDPNGDQIERYDLSRFRALFLAGERCDPETLKWAEQQLGVPVIGWLSPGSRDADQFRLSALERGLAEAAYVTGKNVALEYRWAEGQDSRLLSLAADLTQRRVNVIVAAGVAAAREAKAATSTTPIVFVLGRDPVGLGLIAGEARRAARLRRVDASGHRGSSDGRRLAPRVAMRKRSLAERVTHSPEGRRLAPRVAMKKWSLAAGILGLDLQVLHAGSVDDLDAAFAALPTQQIAGVVIGTDALFNSRSQQLAKLAADRSLPTIHTLPQFAAAGGLVSYGGGLADGYRLVGVYCGRILKGEKPGDLPVQQSTKFELVINLRTAKALGLTVPLALIARADELIE